ALNKKINFEKKHWFLLMLFLLNYSIVYVYSIYRASIYQHSVMLFAGVAMVFFVVSFIEFKNKYVFYAAAFFLTSTLVYKTYFKKQYYAQCVKTVYEQQFERTIHYKKLYGDEKVYPLFFDIEPVMTKIYLAKYHAQFDYKTGYDTTLYLMKNFSHFIASLKCDYLVLTSAFPAQQAVVKEYFPYLIENTQTQVINLKVYSRKTSDSVNVVKDDEVLKFSN